MFAVIELPNFPVQVCFRHGDSIMGPLALVAVAGTKPYISHVNEEAASLGSDRE